MIVFKLQIPRYGPTDIVKLGEKQERIKLGRTKKKVEETKIKRKSKEKKY